MRIDSELVCLLNANGIDVDHVPGGGQGLIDKEAICMALAGSTRPQLGLALYMAGVDEEHKHIWSGLFHRAINSSPYRQLKEKTQSKLDLLCRLAIFEFTHRPHCKQCNGTGKDKNYKSCGSCGGVGIMPISNSKRAAILGKTHKSWYQFRDLYSILMNILQRWQDSNESKLKRKLR